MTVGKFTREFLDKVAHPPSAEDLRDMAFALAWDGDVDGVQLLARIMVEHHQHTRFTDEIDRSDNSQRFYWWLGIRGMVTSLAGGAEHRRTMRSLRRVPRGRR